MMVGARWRCVELDVSDDQSGRSIMRLAVGRGPGFCQRTSRSKGVALQQIGDKRAGDPYA
jgi:hypothetical protein